MMFVATTASPKATASGGNGTTIKFSDGDVLNHWVTNGML